MLHVLVIELIILFFGIFFVRYRSKLSYLGMFFLVLFASIPDLYYVPANYDDLYRYFEDMNTVKFCDNIHSLFVAYKYIPSLQHQSGNYIYITFQWLLAKSGIYALLPFLSIFIVYLCISIPFVHQYISDENVSIRTLIVGFLSIVSLFPYYGVSSTVRWNLASAVFFLIMYISFNCQSNVNRFLTIPLYLIPLLIHQGMIIPVCIVILCILFAHVHIKLLVWLGYILFSLFLIYVLYSASHNVSAGNNTLSSNFQFYNDTDVNIFLGSSYAKVAYWFIFIAPYVYAILSFILTKENKGANSSLEFKVTILIILSDLFLLFDLVISNRYALDVGLIGIITYLHADKYSGLNSKKIRYIYLCMATLGIFVMLFAIIFKMHFNFSQINFNGLFSNVVSNNS